MHTRAQKNGYIKAQRFFIEDRSLARRVRKPRPFDRAECKTCHLKGSAYCWRQCPYNAWRQRQIE